MAKKPNFIISAALFLGISSGAQAVEKIDPRDVTCLANCINNFKKCYKNEKENDDICDANKAACMDACPKMESSKDKKE